MAWTTPPGRGRFLIKVGQNIKSRGWSKTTITTTKRKPGESRGSWKIEGDPRLCRKEGAVLREGLTKVLVTRVF